MFVGDLPRAVNAFRPLVAGVAGLHKAKMVHRDIKPDNIFVSAGSELVLGDFGLIYFTDSSHTRLTGTVENVGSYYWMPPWAYKQRVEDLKPTFDVFSLGKVFWAMVSGREFLPFWYWSRPEHNLERIFPNTPYIEASKVLLARSVVEEEKDSLQDASDLLEEVDHLLSRIEKDGQLLGDGRKRHCRVCGVGEYKELSDNDVDNSPLRRPAGMQTVKAFVCSHCGHLQAFSSPTRTCCPVGARRPWRGGPGRLIGDWRWFDGNTTRFFTDGTFLQLETKEKGKWRRTDEQLRKFEFTWDNGAVNQATVSEDCNSIDFQDKLGDVHKAVRIT